MILILMLLFSMLNGATAQKDVYVIGNTLNTDKILETTYSMRLYKNDVVAHKIESEHPRSMAMFIEKDRDDIYIFIKSLINEKYNQMNILKNDQLLYSIAEDNTSISIKDVYIYNSDIYLVGEKKHNFYIWKNGEILAPIKTNDSNLDLRDVSTICISEGDIYVSGYVAVKDKAKLQVAVWKNGEIINLFCEGASNLAKAKDMLVYRGDVYVLGEGCVSGFDSSILVWKNEKLIYTSLPRATAVKMIESEGSIYVLGQYPRKPTKLFVLKDFQPLFEIVEKKDCEGASMVVDSGNVYVSGNIRERRDLPRLCKVWKDGQTLYGYKGIGKERNILIKGLLIF